MGKYDNRILVAVSPFNGSTILYGFQTNIDANDRQALGQQEIGNQEVNGLVVGANSPKPARASRRRATGTTSSFIDWSVIAAARQAGWRVGTGRLRRGSVGARSRTVFVTYKGINYAWQIPNDTYANLGGDAAALGLREAGPNDTDLVFGAQSPKPPKATRTIGEGEDANQITTFYDPSGQVPAGWETRSGKINTTQAP